MNDYKPTTEDLEKISQLRMQEDLESHYTERPRSQRILAWILLIIMVIGIAYTLIMALTGIMQVHNYTLGKTLLTLLTPVMQQSASV